MGAGVRGSTENALSRMPFKSAYMYRPGYIQPPQDSGKNEVVRSTLRDDGPPLSSMEAAVPEICDKTECVGHAILNVAKRGAPKPVHEN